MKHQSKLYVSAQLKLAAWIAAAMLLISSSFMLPAYFIFSGQLDRPAEQQAHDQLIIMLVSVQAVIITIGTVFSLVFAKKVLAPIRKAHTAQAEFASNAHHQLRTPLTIMRAEIDTLLLNKNSSRENYNKTLQSIREEIDLLGETSENLLALADAAAQGQQLVTQPTSRQLNQILRQFQKRYPIQIKADIDPDLETTLNQQELVIILENLIDNTIKHAGKPTYVEVSLKQGERGVELTFSDDGSGVKKGEEKKLFGRHYSGDSGSGLGLAMVADIVHARKGTVHAGNRKSGGLQITLHL